MGHTHAELLSGWFDADGKAEPFLRRFTLTPEQLDDFARDPRTVRALASHETLAAHRARVLSLNLQAAVAQSLLTALDEAPTTVEVRRTADTFTRLLRLMAAAGLTPTPNTPPPNPPADPAPRSGPTSPPEPPPSPRPEGDDAPSAVVEVRTPCQAHRAPEPAEARQAATDLPPSVHSGPADLPIDDKPSSKAEGEPVEVQEDGAPHTPKRPRTHLPSAPPARQRPRTIAKPQVSDWSETCPTGRVSDSTSPSGLAEPRPPPPLAAGKERMRPG